jgi:putative methyltransferase (TIGR04325 family)
MASNNDFRIWEGVFGSFKESGADASAFESDIWIGKLVERAEQAMAQSAGTAAVAAVTETRDYALPFIAAAIARRNEPLRILDFGGGIATSYFPLIQMLPADQPLEFTVVENETICERGRKMVPQDARILFRSQLPTAARFDIVHCGSSIEYVDDWQGVLTKLVEYEPAFMLFVNLPAADNESFVTAQNYYGKRIPVRFWNFHEFVSRLEKLGYDLMFKSRFRGYWRDAYPEMPTGHFEPAYRADYFTQLVFRRQIGT